ncbi:LysR family transcriptional regulator [Corallococcus sp. M34]|uniref:LysR family transcriptional regulator n=1 Tax=Citreicoccus inhibens TaxID=2849499 RepID=UPI001C230A48|nr:LysR family transcriptional regulator [Citreicoccus inhibens]MBU8896525.1 LysR family transcriptional regulator [Citreicoccus inhibens]
MSPVHARASTAPRPRAAPKKPRELDLTDIDLNLLVALDALLAEVNVTRAAERLGLTQSAMSHALARLREHLGDPLLIRGRGGMVLTPRASQLTAPLHHGLMELQRALRAEHVFEPATAVRSFTVATRDYFAAVMLPPAMALLGHEAPQVDLMVRHVETASYPSLLETGEVDLAVVPSHNEAPAFLRQQKLFTEDFLCAVRRGHPLVRRGLDLDTYLKLSHLLISPQGQGPGIVDLELAKRGLSRRIALRLPYFLITPAILERTDCVVTAPRRMVEAFSHHHALDVFPPPIPLRTFDVRQVWHERFENDPAHRWLRGLVARAAGVNPGVSRTPRASRPVRIPQSS